MPLLGFDIETANIITLARGENLDDHGPLDITVAATHIEGGEELLWLSADANGIPLPMITRDRARELLAYLSRMQHEGHSIVAWNGLSFVCNHGVRIAPSTGPPVEESVAVSGIFDRGQLVIEPWLDDPIPDDDCGL